jgi:hypothetical protein
MRISSSLGGRILVDYWRILEIRAVFVHSFGKGKSGRFTGVSGTGSRETGPDSGPDRGGGDAVVSRWCFSLSREPDLILSVLP